jgi:hypothetical protein
MDTLATLLKTNPPENAIELIRIVKNHVQNPEMIIPVLEKIAAGADGISGTDDDIVSPEIIKTVKSLLELEIIQHIAAELKIPANFCC